MDKNKINQAYTLAFIPSEHKADQTIIPTLIPSKTKRVCQNVHILFFMHKAPSFSSQGFAIS